MVLEPIYGTDALSSVIAFTCVLLPIFFLLVRFIKRQMLQDVYIKLFLLPKYFHNYRICNRILCVS